MQISRRTLILSLWLMAASAAFSRADQPPLKVLFIGNSYTSVNDLPSLVVALADVAGGRKIEVGQHLVGGCTLERQAREGKAVEKIREKKWDVVVLQEQSLYPIINRESLRQSARAIDEEIRKQGARTVLYLTWARQHIPQMQEGADPAAAPEYARAMYGMSGAKGIGFEDWCAGHKADLAVGLNGAYLGLGRELKADVAPVGMAWKKALAAESSLVLHSADKSHPAPNGSYLAACVFYATLLDRSPVGLSGELRKGTRRLVAIEPEETRRLQLIAWQAVQEAKRGD